MIVKKPLQAGSLGCYDYEGSLMGDEYPNYVNPGGRFLTPTAYRWTTVWSSATDSFGFQGNKSLAVMKNILKVND